MMGKHDLIDFKDVELDGAGCRIGIVKVRFGCCGAMVLWRGGVDSGGLGACTLKLWFRFNRSIDRFLATHTEPTPPNQPSPHTTPTDAVEPRGGGLPLRRRADRAEGVRREGRQRL